MARNALSVHKANPAITQQHYVQLLLARLLHCLRCNNKGSNLSSRNDLLTALFQEGQKRRTMKRFAVTSSGSRNWANCSRSSSSCFPFYTTSDSRGCSFTTRSFRERKSLDYTPHIVSVHSRRFSCSILPRYGMDLSRLRIY